MRKQKTGAEPIDCPPFAALYELFAQPVLRYCQVRISNPVEAEDAAALIFARAFAAYPPGNPDTVRSWLFAIAHNVVANHYRTVSARAPFRPLDENLIAPDQRAGPEEIAVARDERAMLLSAVGELTEEQRQVVELRLAGLTGPEIADATGRSHAAVKMLQYRAIQNLRVVLALAEEDPVVLKGARSKETNNGK